MAILVNLGDHTGNTSHEAKMDENAPVERLIPAIITALQLPMTDNAGRPITYHLGHNNRRLPENETLATAGVQTGDTLTIVPEMTAGSQSDSVMRSEAFLPLVILTPGVQQRKTVSGFPAQYHAEFQSAQVQISLRSGVLNHIWQQAKAHMEQEIGGLLVGTVYEEDGQFLVEVEKALEAEHTQAGSGFVTFTEQAWLKMLQQRNDYPDLFVTGWYHSHPGFGIYLSSSDEFIHRNFFGNQPWYLALVVDPFSDEWGIFTLENEKIKRCFAS